MDTLCNITSKEIFEEERETDINININVGEQFSEMFLKNPENLPVILGFLEEYDFRYISRFFYKLFHSSVENISEFVGLH